MRKFLQKDDSIIGEIVEPMTELQELEVVNAALRLENEMLMKQLEECNHGKKCIEEHRNQLLKKFELIDFITKNY